MEKNLPALNYADSKIIETIKQTVAKGASDAELALFIEHCKATGLNPFKKEIWFIKTPNGVQIMTGINGFYEIANRHPQFDNVEVETIEKDDRLIKCIARCYRKDRSRPMVAEAYLSEYGKSYGNWKIMPRTMLSKCAESMALRKSFPQELNGLYTQEEMPLEFAAPEPKQKVIPCTFAAENKPKVDDSELFEKPETEWEAYKYKYHLPVKKQGIDMAKVRETVKDMGWKYNPDDQCWYTNNFSQKLSQYERKAKKEEQAIPAAIAENFPGSVETPLGEQIDGGSEIQGEA